MNNGVIEIVLGNRINRNVAGKTLALRPAIVADAAKVPISWVCGTFGPARHDCFGREYEHAFSTPNAGGVQVLSVFEYPLFAGGKNTDE